MIYLVYERNAIGSTLVAVFKYEDDAEAYARDKTERKSSLTIDYYIKALPKEQFTLGSVPL